MKSRIFLLSLLLAGAICLLVFFTYKTQQRITSVQSGMVYGSGFAPKKKIPVPIVTAINVSDKTTHFFELQHTADWVGTSQKNPGKLFAINFEKKILTAISLLNGSMTTTKFDGPVKNFLKDFSEGPPADRYTLKIGKDEISVFDSKEKKMIAKKSLNRPTSGVLSQDAKAWIITFGEKTQMGMFDKLSLEPIAGTELKNTGTTRIFGLYRNN